MASPRGQYVPLGVIHLDALDHDSFTPSGARWRDLAVSEDDDHGQAPTPPTTTATTTPLSETEEDLILNHPRLRPFRALVHRRWVKLEAGLGGPGPRGGGAVRVHVLPDDRCRQAVDRADPKLRRARNRLVAQLDMSVAAWAAPCGGPADVDSNPHDDGRSLLQLFNMIPSPSPALDRVDDHEARRAMASLLESRVVGLTTVLYPYQRRTAAAMLQREVAPEKVLDPRLARRRDHDGRSWYHDPIGGAVLRDPRQYDGVSGGILAEQMGTGKTLICLAVVLASRGLCLVPPEPYRVSSGRHARRRGGGVVSLARIAAVCATTNGLPWRFLFDVHGGGSCGVDWSSCTRHLASVPGYYDEMDASGGGDAQVTTRRGGRAAAAAAAAQASSAQRPLSSTRVYMSAASLVIVPANLLHQWRQEIATHTDGLRVLVVADAKDAVPPLADLLDADVVLFSQPRFERLFEGEAAPGFPSHIRVVLFKRCIVDEGHRLGNAHMTARSRLLANLDQLRIAHRWIVTGTPAKGVYGVDEAAGAAREGEDAEMDVLSPADRAKDEQADLNRIGTMARFYLRARPWANTAAEPSDTTADWSAYVALRRDRREQVIQSTLNALILRHRLADVSTVLPQVRERIVRLRGTAQDRLSLNVFHMMVVLNAVQSRRTGVDYLFHPRQRRFLEELVRNMSQATFFGALFFPAADVARAVRTAREFARDKAVAMGVGADDARMLDEAIAVGDAVATDELRGLAALVGEIPLLVADLPEGAHAAWSLEGGGGGGGQGQGQGGVACASATLVHALQRAVGEARGSATAWNTFFNGGMVQQGRRERARILEPGAGSMHAAASSSAAGAVFGADAGAALAGCATVGTGEGGERKVRAWRAPKTAAAAAAAAEREKDKGKKKASRERESSDAGDADDAQTAVALPDQFRRARLVATASAKLSYLLDAIGRHQDEEQILVFYDNENVAWHLASALDVVGYKYLIYAKSLSVERRAQYVEAFVRNPEFRILLMDMNQAAFGLDIRVATRIYFISPVLDPQVQAQAIGRARRVSSNGGGGGSGSGSSSSSGSSPHSEAVVTVETLVLRDSIDEVVVERRGHMSRAEHRQCKTVLDDRPIAAWVKSVRVLPMGGGCDVVGEGRASGLAAGMGFLDEPRALFRQGRAGTGDGQGPDDGLVVRGGAGERGGAKRPFVPDHGDAGDAAAPHARPAKRVAVGDGGPVGPPSLGGGGGGAV